MSCTERRAAPIEAVAEIVQAIKSGAYKPGDVTATTGQKTPPTGAPVFGNLESVRRAVTLQVADAFDLSPEIQREFGPDPGESGRH